MSSTSPGSGASHRQTPRGFTLVVTLVILAAVTILVVGLYSIVARESQTSASYDAVDQADLAVQSGLDRAGLLLQKALVDELGVVFSVPLTPTLDEKQRPREMLMAANYDTVSQQWKYQPLASGVASPLSTQRISMPTAAFEKIPAKDPAVGESVEANLMDLRRLPSASPWTARVPRYWMNLSLPSADGSDAEEEGEEGEEKLVGRYCFYIEDLQSKLNLANAGYHDSDSDIPYRQTDLEGEVTPEGQVPVVPGMLIDPGGRWRRHPSSVWTLLRPDLEPLRATDIPQSVNAMHRRLTAINSKRLAFSPDIWREILIAPDALTNWPGIDPLRLTGPEARQANGSLVDAQLRALEENTTGFLSAYDELALVPHSPGFVFGGERKKNLNFYLNKSGGDVGQSDHGETDDAVGEIARHIDRHLPEFKKRAGGFPLPRRTNISQREVHQMAYLKTLAAGMLDYADKDALPSTNIAFGAAGDESEEAKIEYRGTDAHPLINEYWQRHRFEAFLGRKVKCSLTDYVELWNPTNQEISGKVTCCFEYKGRFAVAQRSYPVMSSLHLAGTPKPNGQPGLKGFWYPEQDIKLRPNEIKVLTFGPVVFELDGGDLGNVTGVQYFGQPANANDDHESRYRLAFKPDGVSEYTVVDLPLAPLERYQMSTSLNNRQRFNVNQPGLSYRVRDGDYGEGWAYNVGDTRAAYFIDYNQEVIDYDDGSSPWGRNYRRFENLAGEARTFLWPDGGHSTVPCPTRIGSFARDPDDITMQPADNPGTKLEERQKFVQRISNAGRFYSMTELGHIFDPIMWNPNGKDWNNQPVLYTQHADLKPTNNVKLNPNDAELDAHKRFCGGNSLRVGRVEHSLFRPDYRTVPESGRPLDRGLAASSLLDLFHCGDPNSIVAERITGPLVRIDGHVNINTASREVLRALVAGRLMEDPQLKFTGTYQETPVGPSKDNPNVILPASTSKDGAQADVIADTIIKNRPYITPAEVAEKAVLSAADAAELPKDEELLPLAADMPVFGYTKRDPSEDRVVRPEWNDAAAEELFARFWNNSTVRSRHFKIVVCGQTLKVGRNGQTNVVATRSRLFHVFIRPVRNADGTLESQKIEVTYSRSL